MALVDVHVSRNGYPVLDARRLDVTYSLRDLLPGSTHRFGLTGVSVDGAKLTVVPFATARTTFIRRRNRRAAAARSGAGTRPVRSLCA